MVLTYSAYVAEVFRRASSVQSQSTGAARSLACRSGRPCDTRAAAGDPRVLPPLLNDFARCSGHRLIPSWGCRCNRAAQIESSRTFNYTPYVVAAVLFLILTGLDALADHVSSARSLDACTGQCVMTPC